MDARFLRNVLIKGLAIFFIVNLLFIALPPGLGNVSLYNHLFSGRLRFPFGENPAQSYNLSLFDLDAMFASQLIAAGEKPADEYRVFVIGDSSVWGTLLPPGQTLAGQLDAAGLRTCDGKNVRAYNLGYPTISLTKDLMVLDYALRKTAGQALSFQPDLLVWGMTLEAFPLDKQLSSPIVSNNASRVQDLVTRYDLPFDPQDPALVLPTWWDRTLIGQRRNLADLLRLQLYGVLWSATGIDQVYPSDYTPALADFEADATFHDQAGPNLDATSLAFPVLEAGIAAAGEVPLILFNEPMLISNGINSDLRYNFFYPRWAFDQWRVMMAEKAVANVWNYLDLWDLVPAVEFTNSAIHMTPAGEKLLANEIQEAIQPYLCP